ncbi:MAG: polysaccharide deacetylase family protein [Solirubrobacteraceae bacterium]
MTRIALQFTTGLALALALCLAGAPTSTAAVGDELLANPGVEAAQAEGPAFWSSSTWANTDPTPNVVSFSWRSAAHSGAHSVRVDVTSYTDGGDSKWVPSAIPVTGGAYYTFSDWYKSDVNTAVSIYYETAADPPDGGQWANLFSGIAPASQWTNYKTGFTMPAGAVRAIFVHFIAAKGFLQTDDYSVRQAAAPPGFSKPMLSLTFDDGSAAFYADTRPKLDALGYKTTQYIPTLGLTAPVDPWMMTTGQIETLASQGHEIASHSITHPHLTAPDTDLEQELAGSKALLDSLPGVPTVVSFAYPYGEYDARTIAAASAAGYTSARSVEEGYNSKLDLEPYDIRVQNMTSATTLEQFTRWVDYAKEHRYWLVIVYHETVADNAPVCTDPETASPCLGPYDTTLTKFQEQLNYIAASGVTPMTVRDALALADGEIHPAPTLTPVPTPSPAPTPMTSPSLVPAPTASADKLAPRILVASPRARTYKVGQKLKISFSARDSSGVARYKATLRRVGGNARTVRKGATVRLTRAGAYVLRVTATDRKGNTATKTVHFRVTRR